MNIRKFTLILSFALGILLPLMAAGTENLLSATPTAKTPPAPAIKDCILPDTMSDADKAKITNIQINCTDNYNPGGGGWDAKSASCPSNKVLIGTAYLPASHWNSCASHDAWGDCVGGTVLDKACYIQCAPDQSVVCS